jgi:CheY-like chemotaxis protein
VASDGASPAGCRILLVEDELANRALVRAILARAGSEAFVLDEAISLAEARQSLSAGAPDVILLDVRLPDGSGLDLVPEIRETTAARRPGIIVMSASVLPAERTMATAAGVDGFIAKPYAAGELLDALRAYCPGPGVPLSR